MNQSRAIPPDATSWSASKPAAAPVAAIRVTAAPYPKNGRTPAYMDPAKITDITIHCAATPEGKAFTAAQISAMDIARADLGNQVAYHYVIELDGSIVQTLRLDQKGAHTGGHNSGNIGISYVGGVMADGKTPKDTRTPAQKAAMISLIKTLRGRYPGARVRGHRDWPGVAKACPCFDTRAWLAALGVNAG